MVIQIKDVKFKFSVHKFFKFAWMIARITQ